MSKHDASPMQQRLPVSDLQGAANKSNPCRVLLISQQRIGIFKREFTQLFVIRIYV